MRVLLAGATGYIGQAVLRELISQGYEAVALVRPGRALGTELPLSITVIEAQTVLVPAFAQHLPETDAVLPCLASRSGAPADARQVEV